MNGPLDDRETIMGLRTALEWLRKRVLIGPEMDIPTCAQDEDEWYHELESATGVPRVILRG